MSFLELFKSNLRLVYRNSSGLFWTILLPVVLYVAISLLPINRFIQINTSYQNYLLPGLIALVIMQSGIYTLAYWLVELRARGVVTRFLVTPINALELITSVLAARVTVMVVQAVLLTAAGLVFFRTPLSGNPLYAILFVLLGGFTFLLFGLLISTFGNSYEATAPITTAVGLPLTFLSSVFYPLDTLPEALANIARVLPITYLADGLRQVYLANPALTDIWRNLLILLAWSAGLLLLVAWRLKSEQE